MESVIFIALLLILITIVIHVGVTRYILFLAKKHINSENYHLHFPKAVYLTMVAILLFATSIFEAVIWGISYQWVGAIESFSEALYFSTVTFTTLGYGDVTLNDPWRLLGGFQASIGILIFGWSTAIVTTVVQKLYFK